MTTNSSTSAPPIYSVRELTKSYGEKTILSDLSFDLDRGESLVILGRSGSGKSVTLRQLNGLEKPDSGTILFDGEDITPLDEVGLYRVRRRVSMLFQSGALFDSMTVAENIAFPLLQHTDLGDDEIAARVRRSLDRVRLGPIESRVPADLSGGMRKRVALARSLVIEPEVVLFDEPTTGLDPTTSATIARLIRHSQKELNVTSVVVTHDLPLARTVGDRVAYLRDGQFAFLGTWDEANDCPDRGFQRFLAGEPEEDQDAA